MNNEQIFIKKGKQLGERLVVKWWIYTYIKKIEGWLMSSFRSGTKKISKINTTNSIPRITLHIRSQEHQQRALTMYHLWIKVRRGVINRQYSNHNSLFGWMMAAKKSWKRVLLPQIDSFELLMKKKLKNRSIFPHN